jgi:hypothetical protein
MGKSYVFLYVWKQSNELELSESIRLVRKYFFQPRIIVVGDKPKTPIDQYIPHKQIGNNRGARTTGSILEACKHLDEFVLMWDDQFISDSFNPETTYHRGELIVDKKQGNYSIAVHNTINFLEHYGKPTRNYECHQPYLFNSKKLVEVMDKVAHEHHHLIKSIYCNWYELEDAYLENLKTEHVSKAKTLWNKYGAFSTADNIKQEMVNFIKTL